MRSLEALRGSPGSVRLQVLWDSGQPCQRALLGALPCPGLELNAPNIPLDVEVEL